MASIIGLYHMIIFFSRVEGVLVTLGKYSAMTNLQGAKAPDSRLKKNSDKGKIFYLRATRWGDYRTGLGESEK